LAQSAAAVRERVLAAKAGAAVIASALLVLPALVLTVGVAQVWVGGRDDYHFGSHEYELIGRLFVAAAMVATIGFFIGASLKRQLGAVILVLGWLFFVENAIAGLWPGTNGYLIGPSIGGVLGDSGGESPSFVHALAVFGVYIVGLGAVAVALTRRRDIT
jgi:ABC-type transport system involved in multi-copper enzyme maturation permease subunit